MAVVADWRPREIVRVVAVVQLYGGVHALVRTSYLGCWVCGLYTEAVGDEIRCAGAGENSGPSPETVARTAHWRRRRRGHLEDSRGAHGRRVPTAPALRRLTAGP